MSVGALHDGLRVIDEGLEARRAGRRQRPAAGPPGDRGRPQADDAADPGLAPRGPSPRRRSPAPPRPRRADQAVAAGRASPRIRLDPDQATRVPSPEDRPVFSTFFIDRPIFAAVLSIVITLAGGVAVFTLPLAQYPPITPPTVAGRLQLPRRQRPGRRRGRRRADRAAGQRRRGHAVHVLAVHQRRHLHPDRHVRARRRPEHGPGAGAEPRQPGPAAAARRASSRPASPSRKTLARHPAWSSASTRPTAATTSST